jgi:hypothetical protein
MLPPSLFLMFHFLLLWLGAILRLFRSRRDLLVENLALRQQLTVFKRRNRRPKLAVLDKLFWVLARCFWSDWKKSLFVVAPETVVRWHGAGFRMYWSMISKIRRRVGRRRISREVRDLIFQMVAENPTWGAPRIHGELLMQGFNVSERSISRWMKRAPRDPEPARRWPAFLRNHREAITAMDFFTVPAVTFQLLYCFFIDERFTSWSGDQSCRIHHEWREQAGGQAMLALGRPAELSTGAIAIFNIWRFLLGVAAVWLYAAIRPRYGAGPNTAIRAGLVTWAVAVFLSNLGYYPLGPIPPCAVAGDLVYRIAHRAHHCYAGWGLAI